MRAALKVIGALLDESDDVNATRIGESEEGINVKKFVDDNVRYVYIVREADPMDSWLSKTDWPARKPSTPVTAVFRHRENALNYASNLGGRAYRVAEESPIVKAWLSTGQPIRESTKAEIEAEAAKAEEPASEEQAEAGNYSKGHVSVQGMEIAIENAKGSTRSGVDKDGKPWSVKMPAHYGYLKGTVGKDKDHLDVYVGDNPSGLLVFVVNQQKLEGGFDEHKIFLGFRNKEEAIDAYDRAFSGDLGPKLRESVVSTTVDGLKAWIKSGNTKKPFKPVSESVVAHLLDENIDVKKFVDAGENPNVKFSPWNGTDHTWDVFWREISPANRIGTLHFDALDDAPPEAHPAWQGVNWIVTPLSPRDPIKAFRTKEEAIEYILQTSGRQ